MLISQTCLGVRPHGSISATSGRDAVRVLLTPTPLMANSHQSQAVRDIGNIDSVETRTRFTEVRLLHLGVVKRRWGT